MPRRMPAGYAGTFPLGACVQSSGDDKASLLSAPVCIKKPDTISYPGLFILLPFHAKNICTATSSSLIQTILSVPESHRVSRQRQLADYTAGGDFHPAPMNFLLFCLFIIHPTAMEIKHFQGFLCTFRHTIALFSTSEDTKLYINQQYIFQQKLNNRQKTNVNAVFFLNI